MKDGAALERLAEVDRAVFDKTGTLTTGEPVVTGGGPQAEDARAAARTLALASTHPVSRAVAAHLPRSAGSSAGPPRGSQLPVSRASSAGAARGWVAGPGSLRSPAGRQTPPVPPLPLRACRPPPSISPNSFAGTRDAVRALQGVGIASEMLTGDGPVPAGRVARAVEIACIGHSAAPADKIARLAALRETGHRALMVGDGLNDIAALAAAHVSMAPASASDAGRAAADLVFTRERLDAVAAAHEVAVRAAALVRENFGLAVLYNCVAIPLAVAGLVTPLLAAIAMSASSMLVVANALRLNQAGRASRPDRQAALTTATVTA